MSKTARIESKTARIECFSEERRKKENKFSIGRLGLAVVIGGVGAALYAIRPKDPVFEVLSIHVKGVKLNLNTDTLIPLAFLDVELSISIKITNPNLMPIEHKSTVMCIYYKGSLLGQAQVPEGGQGGNCSKVLEVPTKIDGVEVTQHIKDLVKDVSRREMDLKSVVNIKGSAWLWKLGHKFEVVVESEIKVDPISLDVIQQENRVHLEL
uniref:Late embryogenesis abundant protein LEA-2 subgroup domain-containing protein n=1 Tax=Picea sitchensis TaxID=3332 RepID=B8LPI4_PICSI|nr:unknown [Picea sitchensis]